MKREFIFAVFCGTLFSVNACVAADVSNNTLEKQAEIAAQFITKAASKLSNGKPLYKAQYWHDNAEVKEVREFSSAKRAVVLYESINFLAKYEALIFDKQKNNQHHLAESLLTRLRTLEYFRDLVTLSGDELILREYLDGEISDIRMVIASRISLKMYIDSRATRDEKLTSLLMTEKKLVSERINLYVNKDPFPKRLADITTMHAFMEICASNLGKLCVKL